ncbi:unnamed protein product [Porites lobata]|uniref:Uncharacterized protein n=1 Tax=Porites lobata TaxID=104759 RepID=A0ABN8NIB6_9CNID|nr:unnamed protein product [Porites lobata]
MGHCSQGWVPQPQFLQACSLLEPVLEIRCPQFGSRLQQPGFSYRDYIHYYQMPQIGSKFQHPGFSYRDYLHYYQMPQDFMSSPNLVTAYLQCCKCCTFYFVIQLLSEPDKLNCNLCLVKVSLS